jgi:hypothetical protein
MGVALFLAFALVPVSDASVPGGSQGELWVAGGDSVLGCDEVRGSLLAFSKPGIGTLFLSLEPFPGAEPVGAVVEGELRFSIPGTRMREQRFSMRAPVGPSGTLYGNLFRNSASSDTPYCVGFTKVPSSADGVTETYAAVREIAAMLPAFAREKPIEIRDRDVVIQWSAPGEVETVAREARWSDVRLPGAGAISIFCLIVTVDTPLVVVKLKSSSAIDVSLASLTPAWTRVELDGLTLTARVLRIEPQ